MYKSRTYNTCKYSLPIIYLLPIIHEGCLSLEDGGNKQSNFPTELKHFVKGIKTVAKNSFLNKSGLFFGVRDKFLKNRLLSTKNLDETWSCEQTFESGFQPTHETATATKAAKTKTKRKIASLKLC